MPADRLRFAAVILTTLCTLPAHAGDLDSPAAPGSPASAMYTLEDIYNRLDSGAAGAKRSGLLQSRKKVLPVSGT